MLGKLGPSLGKDIVFISMNDGTAPFYHYCALLVNSIRSGKRKNLQQPDSSFASSESDYVTPNTFVQQSSLLLISLWERSSGSEKKECLALTAGSTLAIN
jgi:hypothetical protein